MDDLKIYYEVVTEEDFIKIQNDISKVQDWCVLNEMKTNLKKCAIISFSRKKFPMIYNYKINSNELSRVTTVEDLGIIFDTRLNFHEHVNVTITKANRLWGFIWRNSKHFKNWQTVRILYLTLIRAVFVYGSPIWRPYT